MKCAIIGWYGTETIGDRAILASLIKMFHDVSTDVEIYIGSIYPFFTERTLSEDSSFINRMCKKDVKLYVFDSRNHFKLKQIIKEMDCIVVGGGPLLVVSSMYMIKNALMKAKKMGKRTGLLGCGLGPLYKKQYIKATRNILKYSDVMIFRDEYSRQSAVELLPEREAEMLTLIDPAVFSAAYFKRNYVKKNTEKEYVALNLREFPREYLDRCDDEVVKQVDEKIKSVVKEILKTEGNLKLIPMHYFGIGGDDRVFLNKISIELEKKDTVFVQNAPLSLEETMQIFAEAKYCVGMRFHSVVLQTIVNGNNYIIDYTAPQKGKISGFLATIDKDAFYLKRYVNLQNDDVNELIIDSDNVVVDFEMIDEYEKNFENAMKTGLL